MPKQFKPPKSLAICADMLYTTRNERLAKEAEVELLKTKESALREHIINNLPKSSASGITGKIAYAEIKEKIVVKVDNWESLITYCIKNRKKGAFAMIQHRISPSAVEDLWAAGKKVPGCSPFKTKIVSSGKRS